MFNWLFGNKRTLGDYVVIARYRGGHWFRQFDVKAYDSYEAARTFDQENTDWTRVSGATLKNPLLP